MSSEDRLSQKIRAKIQWHNSEIIRLQAIIDEFEGGGSQMNLTNESSAQAPHGKTVRPASLIPARTLNNSPFMKAVHGVLKEGESLNSREIADRLKAAGYKSGAKAYYPTIYNQLVWWDRKGEGVVKVGNRSTGVLFRRR